MKKKIVFLTGTRADFGKLKSLIEILRNDERFEVQIFATGMHLDERYGYTVHEIEKCGYANIFTYINHHSESLMDLTFAKTIEGFAAFVHKERPDLIVVHGDRIEALAGASVGALNNVLVAHIEGGELSGTVDELIRHAVSKLSHIHFTANAEAKRRLMQMGEREESIFIIGSPDIDLMLSDSLPSLEEAKDRYGISFEEYAISLFHPVTTEEDALEEHAANYFEALNASEKNYIVIYPNNDKGSHLITGKIAKLHNTKNYKVFPSIRFEYFLTLLKNALFIIGNSSAGVREAPCYGIPAVNVGTRQNGRTLNPDIIHCGYSVEGISAGITEALIKKPYPQHFFGTGNSDLKFLETLCTASFWEMPKQKIFADQDFAVVQ